MRLKNKKKQKRLGWGAGVLMRLSGNRPGRASDAELYKADFHPNTQKMGLCFTERIRNVFRFHWLKMKS